jgi:hypothetical protein
LLFNTISKTRIAALMGLSTIFAVSAPLAARAQQPAAAPTVAPRAAARPATTVAARPTATTAAARPVAKMVVATRPAAPAGDPYGFTGWLNSVRAGYGLAPVGHDPNLTNWAAMNNAQQQSHGIGHHVMGPARRQNSAMGGYASIGAMWLSSPAHRAALLDPGIRWIGIAGLGAYWTFNAY